MQFERPLEQTVVGLWDYDHNDILQVGVIVNGHCERLPAFWNRPWIGVIEHDGVNDAI